MDSSQSTTTFEWHPRRVFERQQHDESPSCQTFSVVVLNQPISNLPVLRNLWAKSSFRVAADGGANQLLEASRDLANNLDVIIGDLDSFTASSAEFYSSLPSPPQVIKITEQESTDFSKAVTHIRSRTDKPSDIVAIGGLGGRVDQGLSQMHHLCIFQEDPSYGQGRVYLVSEESLTFLLKPGKHNILVPDWAGLFGKHVGIIPIKGPAIISTKGLEWNVKEWRTEFGGRISTSNHLLPETEVVEVETDKDVIFTIALK
ncbi:hypothetical protein MCOR27_011524 [Pyricularia oryzae]|uniref:Thiamine pyrophosphokinase n=2 Tax=Pyricularia TaxID=48558 RepID=A0ABQ8NCI1_PYRGI|nr:hypothetical protein MCOR01_003576 [Pyricularia oryzae]KAI6294833.1 hypothetical protein MCOR33_008160 [Pyricularia grisea]KAH9432113.1 hypothetical protein MCOR02_006817 [Pyricularia oryzae]KAI6255464.1 hypothetical protein MCOR19_008026 [Pyricularia oryzae]KAI6265096.1 hypothetical protein MCOR27_011524 [Pyricularia oryzae]